MFFPSYSAQQEGSVYQCDLKASQHPALSPRDVRFSKLALGDHLRRLALALRRPRVSQTAAAAARKAEPGPGRPPQGRAHTEPPAEARRGRGSRLRPPQSRDLDDRH